MSKSELECFVIIRLWIAHVFSISRAWKLAHMGVSHKDPDTVVTLNPKLESHMIRAAMVAEADYLRKPGNGLSDKEHVCKTPVDLTQAPLLSEYSSKRLFDKGQAQHPVRHRVWKILGTGEFDIAVDWIEVDDSVGERQNEILLQNSRFE